MSSSKHRMDRNRQSRSPIINDDQARRMRLRHAQKQNRHATPMTWTYGRFGLRWKTSVDRMNLPDAPGAFVLFFSDKRKVVGAAENLYRSITQYWHAPGPSLLAFSWLEIQPVEACEYVSQMLQQRSYDQLWEDIRPHGMRDEPE